MSRRRARGPAARALRAMPAAAAWLALLAVLGAAGCSDGRIPLTVYSPHGRDLLALMEKSFEARHPQIDVRWLDMGSQDVLDRIRTEAPNPQADVWYGGPRAVFARGAADGLLAAYRPAWADSVPPASRNARSLFFGVYRTAPVLVFNSAVVAAAAAPRDWDDLLLPRWKGAILMRDPLASGTLRTLFAMVLTRSVAATGSTRAGFDWLRRLDAQTKEYLQNPALLMEKLNRREGLLTVWELTDMLWQKQRGAPLDFRFPSSGTPVIDDSIGLVNGSRHPAEARAFIDFVGSPEGLELAASRAFRLPARTDLPAASLPAWARQVLASLIPARMDWALAQSHEQAWMATWDQTVRGHGAEREARH
jgi:iron(III) transport system substrate-binding protein